MDALTLTIEDDQRGLNPTELADFLYLFRAVTLALRDVIPAGDSKSKRVPSIAEVNRYRSSICRFSPGQLNKYFDTTKSRHFFEIENIQRNSPMELIVGGVGFLLAVGVIISGGSISFTSTGVKAKLPPLGKGVKLLRESLGIKAAMKAGFGLKDVTIKLNQREFELLMQQNPLSEANGGFQHFLVGLQLRVNKRTKELELSQRDLQRIHRYMQNPAKGGWQARFNKIFSRHFPQLMC
ncbi:MAG: hypothetical protein JWO95_2633 [Verrucomicrobiales bacterium]|nr:hypothetical protein [Verrucomicrobiales bacterium]